MRYREKNELTLRAEISILTFQICVHFQTRAFTLCLGKLLKYLEDMRFKSKKHKNCTSGDFWQTEYNVIYYCSDLIKAIVDFIQHPSRSCTGKNAKALTCLDFDIYLSFQG